MKLKDVYDLIDGIALISLPEDKGLHYGNCYMKEPTEEILEREVKAIEPFYSRQGLYKYGVIIRLKELENG